MKDLLNHKIVSTNNLVMFPWLQPIMNMDLQTKKSARLICSSSHGLIIWAHFSKAVKQTNFLTYKFANQNKYADYQSQLTYITSHLSW